VYCSGAGRQKKKNAGELRSKGVRVITMRKSSLVGTWAYWPRTGSKKKKEGKKVCWLGKDGKKNSKIQISPIKLIKKRAGTT